MQVPYTSMTEEEYHQLVLQFYVTSLGTQKAQQILTAHGIDFNINQYFTNDNSKSTLSHQHH